MSDRPHSGRRRNELARQAILDATDAILRSDGPGKVSIEDVARRAGVGKQTIYRWWPSRGALLLETTVERARVEVPAPDTGTLAGDLEEFLGATFAQAPRWAPALRALVAEAQIDADVAESFRAFTAQRRAVLTQLLERGRARDELAPDTDLSLLVDIAYGVLWYRVLTSHGALDRASGVALARRLIAAR
jgi:AcrR family transcriptional regulator